MWKKTIIGLVGEKCGGKGTFLMLIQKLVPNMHIGHHKFSDPLTETLKSWRMPLTRANYQNLTPIMRQTYGTGVLANALQQRVMEEGAQIIVLDGIRWWEDVHMLKNFPNHTLIYITADPRTRYERSRLRNEKAGENESSWNQFLAEEKAETEKDIPSIGKTADMKIENNGTVPEFEEKIKLVLGNIFHDHTSGI